MRSESWDPTGVGSWTRCKSTFYSAFHGLGVWFILEAGTYLMSLCPLPLGVSTPWTWRCSAAGCSWFRARSTWCSAKRFSALKCTCIMSAISLSLAFHVASPALHALHLQLIYSSQQPRVANAAITPILHMRILRHKH